MEKTICSDKGLGIARSCAHLDPQVELCEHSALHRLGMRRPCYALGTTTGARYLRSSNLKNICWCIICCWIIKSQDANQPAIQIFILECVVALGVVASEWLEQKPYSHHGVMGYTCSQEAFHSSEVRKLHPSLVRSCVFFNICEAHEDPWNIPGTGHVAWVA